MSDYEVTMRITARDDDHAREIMEEISQRMQDARDSGDFDDGEANFDDFSLKEVL